MAGAREPKWIAQLAIAAERYNRGDFAEAGRLCARILRAHPHHAQALHLAGLVALAQGDARSARQHLERAAARLLDPGLFVDLAAALIETGELRAAEERCRRALAISPAHAEAHYNLGTALYRLRDCQAAVTSLREALRLKPDFFPARVNLALALRGIGAFLEAREHLERVLAQRPSDLRAWLYCGIVNHDLGEFARAVECFERALALKAADPEVLCNLAAVYRDMGEFERAQELYERVLASAPEDAPTRNDYAQALLARGEFARGWEHYEARWAANGWQDPAYFRQPRWRGEPLCGKSLLVWGEQGIGDQIMFASMVPQLLETAAACTITCDAKLVPLFARAFSKATVLARSDQLHAQLGGAAFDFQTPIGSLAQWLRRDFEDFPRHAGYLRADADKTEAWRQRLAALGPGKKIGISWRGGFVNTRRHLRSIELEAWLPLLQLPGVQFVSLQYTDCAAELKALRERHGLRVYHWQEAIDDYDQTAALVCALDGIVSVCTALVHLAGALGRPAWVLVPAVPEWRYLRAGERMPWYPSVTLLRQTCLGDWHAVMQEAAARLRAA